MEQKKSFKLPSYMRNIYFIAILAFVVWICFLDRYNLIAQYELSAEQRKMETQKSFYLTEIEKNQQEKEDLLSDQEKREKFAREKYYMKKDSEDLYIIVPEKKDN